MTQYNSKELEKYGGKKILMFGGTVTASGNNRTNTSFPILNVMPFKEASFFLNVSAVGGAGTFDLNVESKNPAGDIYETLASFTQLAAIGHEKKNVAANLGEALSLAWTVATFTSVTFEVYGIFKIR